MQAPLAVSRWKQALIAVLLAGPVLLSTLTSLAGARSQPLGLQPLVRQGFRLGVEWLWFFALCFALVQVVRFGARAPVSRLGGAFVNAVLAFAGATAISIVIAFNDSAAFAANLGRGHGSPLWFVTSFAKPGTWLADLLFDATVGPPDPSAVLAGLVDEDSTASTPVRDVDGRSVVVTVDRRLNGSLVRLDSRGELDPTFYGMGALLNVPGDVVPVSDVALLADTTDGLMRVERGRGVTPIVVPQGTLAVLPATQRPLAYLRVRRSSHGALWLAFSYDVVGPEHAKIPLAMRISETLERQSSLRQDQLPAELHRTTEDSERHHISPVALSADGRLAFDIRRGEVRRIVVLGPDAKLERTLALDLPERREFFSARFVGEDQLVVLLLNWEEHDGEMEPRVLAERFDLGTGERTEVKTTLSQKGLIASGSGAFADGSVLVDAVGGPVFRAADFSELPERDARLRSGRCASTLVTSHPALELDDGVLVRVGRRFLAGDAGGAPIAPFLKVRADGSLDEAWNPRLIRRLCP